MEAISDASMVMLKEELENRKNGGDAWTEEQRDLRRSELYRQHLDAIGLDIVEREQ